MPWIKEVEKKGRGQLWRSKFRSWKSIHLLCCLSARQDWARVLQTVYSYSIPQLQGCEQPCVTVLTKTNPPIPFLLHTMQPLLLPSADLHQGRLCKQWCSGNINNHSLDCGSIVWSGEIRISTYLPVARWSQPLKTAHRPFDSYRLSPKMLVQIHSTGWISPVQFLLLFSHRC